MLAELAATGESDAAFARRTGTALHRIYYWRNRLAGEERSPRARRSASNDGFVPVRIVGGATSRDDRLAPDACQVEACLVSGVRLVFRGKWDVEALRPWLASLEATHAR